MTDTPVTRLRELHRRCSCWGENCGGVRPNVDANSHCAKCIVTWPCDTIAALDALEAEAEWLRAQAAKALDAQRAEIDALQARLDAATVLIRQAMGERHTGIVTDRTGGVWINRRRCGSDLGTSIATCENCAPYRAWLAGDKEAGNE